MKKHYDLVIANPPYSKGNMVTKTIIDIIDFDEFINLMPLSCYRHQELYKHVKSLILVDPSSFAGASITDNLNVAVLTKEKLDKTYQELELLTFDEKFRKYFTENLSRKESWIWSTVSNRQQLEKLIEDDKTFFLTVRTILDGVHKKDSSYDIQANIHKNLTTDCLDQITFKTRQEKLNIQAWWYHSTIATSICRATKKQGGIGTHPIFLPRVDWSRSWTDEEILSAYGYSRDEIADILDINNTEMKEKHEYHKTVNCRNQKF